MPVLAVAHDVDDHVLAELLAVLGREAAHARHRLDVGRGRVRDRDRIRVRVRVRVGVRVRVRVRASHEERS